MTTVTTVFVECVSCGEELVVGRTPMTNPEAARKAQAQGWQVAGSQGRKRTRCPRCRKAGRRDTQAADEGRIGNRAGRQTRGR
jgi:hypothetical protein